MKFARTGIILDRENYDDCVAFYRDLFGPGILRVEQLPGEEVSRLTQF